ncbi:hypothetical protein PRIPAC_94303 [Pristionchus pacificus]|uniref:Major sperm protein n=1 Tax=Pristionchus pacificus TaxID=54126 RepID=A0A2A6BPQ1_PRIPA|nr:hypothetical protein PRIPAC_94303 [Pristionchus pacificus]|eukprot:PDM67894.1 MSP domain-containing protein [Pristionchus pacificus]
MFQRCKEEDGTGGEEAMRMRPQYETTLRVVKRTNVVHTAKSVPPGDIATQPGTKIVFNAPYDSKHTYNIKVTNSSARRIGWAFKTTNMKRLGADPAAGVLDPKENALVAVSCDAFAYGQEAWYFLPI